MFKIKTVITVDIIYVVCSSFVTRPVIYLWDVNSFGVRVVGRFCNVNLYYIDNYMIFIAFTLLTIYR